jgi:hypothetical protein
VLVLGYFIMSGVIARLIAQSVVFVVGVLGKAFQEAYVKAQAQGGAAGKQALGGGKVATAIQSKSGMALDQARQILNLEKNDVTLEKVMEAFNGASNRNDPDTSGGSLYVQTKIYNAKEALLAQLKEDYEKRKAARKEAGKFGNSTSSSNSSGEKLR